MPGLGGGESRQGPETQCPRGYRLENCASVRRSLASLSAESGELLVSLELDRERMREEACALGYKGLLLKIRELYHVNVEIEDVNDHTPKFSQSFL